MNQQYTVLTDEKIPIGHVKIKASDGNISIYRLPHPDENLSDTIFFGNDALIWVCSYLQYRITPLLGQSVTLKTSKTSPIVLTLIGYLFYDENKGYYVHNQEYVTGDCCYFSWQSIVSVDTYHNIIVISV